MPQKKFFRVAVEGDIADQRDIKITREWIEEMAASYNPELHGARINLEHIRGIDPEGMFKAYGDVTALKAEDVDIGGETMLALLAEIDPTDELIELSKKRQKVYTSIEVQPQFKKTGGAYLVGLAITDSPAALGVEMLKFSASQGDENPLTSRKQSADNCICQSNEIALDFSIADAATPGFIEKFSARIEEIFSGLKKSNKDQTNDIANALELFSTEFEAFAKTFKEEQSTAIAELTEKLSTLQKMHDDLQTEFSSLNEDLEGSEQFARRPPATGGDSNDAVTDC